ncbi:MAG TPA: nucleoid-associated protein [Bacillales bacterium]|nr:nucleoid-associated protein [Bacillales bacterium]
MQRFKRIFDAMYHIDLVNNTIVQKEVGAGDLDEYIVELLETIVKLPDSRFFGFESENTEVKTLLDKLIEEKNENEEPPNCLPISDAIANRLLRKEVEAQEKYSHITKLQKGSLIQSLVEYKDQLYFLISKVEHESFLNTEDLVRQIGLPYEKKALKTCLIKFTAEDDIESIIVSDTNVRISQYWVKDFLELKEKNSDEKNTSSAFNAIDLILTRKIKKQSPSDYSVLRNNLIGYFRTQEEFSFENMVGSVFGEYVPERPEIVDMNKIKDTVNKLPEQVGFDKRFSIISKEISARIRKVVKISDKIELNLKDHINQLKKVIRSETTPDGQKVIVIKTDNSEAYEMFKFRE